MASISLAANVNSRTTRHAPTMIICGKNPMQSSRTPGDHQSDMMYREIERVKEGGGRTIEPRRVGHAFPQLPDSNQDCAAY